MRRWQFNLRTIFALVTIVATGLGWYAWAGGLLEGRVRPTLTEVAIYACPFAVLFVGREHRALGLDFGMVQFAVCFCGAMTAYYLFEELMSMADPTPPLVQKACAAVVVWTFAVPVSLLVESLALSRGRNLTGLRWFHWFTSMVVTVNIGLLTYLCFWFSRQLPDSWW